MPDNNRYNYANGFVLRVGDNDVLLGLGVNEDPTKPNELIEVTRVAMSPKTAKMLMISLQNGLTALEEAFGAIQIPEDKMAALAVKPIKTA